MGNLRSVVIFALICSLVVGLAGCKSGSREKEEPNSGGARGPRNLTVRTTAVTAQDVVYTIQALGSLEADELVQVPAQVNGAVTDVLFNEGDRVTSQTVLLKIDPERYRLLAEQAEAAHRKALADLHRAEADLRRRQALSEQQLVAVEELNRSQQETERLAAEAAAAKAALDIAVQNRERSLVRASRTGIINTRTVNTGQFVQAGNVVATLVDIGRLRLRFKVSEGESLSVKEGQRVAFRVSSLGNRNFEARVYHVGDVADPATRQVEVLAWVKNPGLLKPGFFAEVALDTQAHRQSAVVPEAAVQASERGFVAYAVENGTARMKPVQIGLRTGDGSVEIVSGLNIGERVVVEGSDRLSDGMAVQEAGGKPSNAAQAGGGGQ